jgi:hypothetical protein
VVYSFAIDESRGVKGTGQLSAFIRRVNEDSELVAKLLELVPMKGQIGADEIFSQMLKILSKFELLWESTVGFVSDGCSD